MCSIHSAPPPEPDLAARLGAAIDELAAAAGDAGKSAEEDLPARLAAAWALVTAADPELAARTTHYAQGSPTPSKTN
jgi:hypothetical protein